MAFDLKKAEKSFYQPGRKPELVRIPEVNYIAVKGQGDPNETGGAYQNAIGLLYGVAYTIKMSKKGNHPIPGYYDYVVPPLEGFWKQEGTAGLYEFDTGRKQDFCWTSVIRLPDFAGREEVEWAIREAERKKKQDFSAVEYLTVEEGLCVQMMHIGPYDQESVSVALMDRFLLEQGYRNDFSDTRLHHEIYLSDPRRTAPEKWKTIIRHPVAPK